MKKITCLIAFSILLLFSGSSFSEPVQWGHEDGGNGHWYDAILFSGTWHEANNNSMTRNYAGFQGHLATLTSVSENQFVWQNFPLMEYFLGGYQINNNDEPSGNWTWVTGEPWVYTNWHGPEPNDGIGYSGGPEDYLEFKGTHEGGTGEWNDIFEAKIRSGYIIEYDYEPVPEPNTIFLFGFGLVSFLLCKFRFIRESIRLQFL